MKYCHKCGNQIDDKAMYCPICGTPQQQTMNNQHSQYNSKKDKPGCGTVLLWIFFWPIMLWVHAFRKKQAGWFIFATVVSLILFVMLIGSTGNGEKYTKAPQTKPQQSLYRTINYEDCARYPEKYKGVKALLEGTVLQVLGSRERGFTIRLATSGSYDDIYYLSVNYDPGFNILENDKLTVYSELTGTQSYQALLGNTVTIPSARADWIELSKSEVISTPVMKSDENNMNDFYIFATSISQYSESTKEPELLIGPKN